MRCSGAFHDEHERLYGYCYRDRPDAVIEWVNLGLPPSGRSPARSRPRSLLGQGRVPSGPGGSSSTTGSIRRSTTVICLGAGDRITGPAIIEEFGSTTPILAGFTVVVDTFGNLVVTK